MQHEDAVYSAQFSSDGQRVVTASHDNTARVWDVPTISGKEIAEEVLLLADLAEATCGVALQTSGQTEILSVLTRVFIHRLLTRTTDSTSAPCAWPPSGLPRYLGYCSWVVSAHEMENKARLGTLFPRKRSPGPVPAATGVRAPFFSP
jgi:hypothetical protein